MSLCSFSLCEEIFDFKISSKSASGNYSIELSLKKGETGNYSFELYDLNTGKVVEKTSLYFNAGQNQAVFDNVKPSTYTVYFNADGCKTKKSIQTKGLVLQ